MNSHSILLTTKRNSIVDYCYWGSVYLADNDGIYRFQGLKKDTISFMRSLAKPLQASIIADCNIVNDYKLKKSEIAMFCASHAGSKLHIDILKKILKRNKMKISELLLEPQYPLDMRDFKGKKTKLHNNCSAKHIMMLLMSKYLNFGPANYTNPNHPIQKLIYKKQSELSQYKSDILTFDGCGTPLWGLPVENIIKAYFNLFNNSKYDFIFESILKNSYLYGGFNRFDSEIIKMSNSKLFAKVGAGGFVLVYNFEKKQILLVKMAQNNNEARKLVTLDILNKLKWLQIEPVEFELNQKKKKVAKYCYEFNL